MYISGHMYVYIYAYICTYHIHIYGCHIYAQMFYIYMFYIYAYTVQSHTKGDSLFGRASIIRKDVR